MASASEHRIAELVFCLVGVRLVAGRQKRCMAFKAVGALHPTAFFICDLSRGIPPAAFFVPAQEENYERLDTGFQNLSGLQTENPI